MVMLKIWKTRFPAVANTSNTAAVTQQARRAVRMRCSGVSVGVIARNDGMAASGSTITKSELAASRMYSSKLMRGELEINWGKSQRGRIWIFGHRDTET